MKVSFLGPGRHNVACSFLYKLSTGLAQGVWAAGNASIWIKDIEGGTDERPIGYVSGLQGTCMAIIAYPAAWVADRTRRDVVLKCCGLLSIGGIACCTTALLIPQRDVVWRGVLIGDNKYLLWCVGAVFWGFTNGCGAVSDALLADSTPTGSRSLILSWLYSGGLVASSVGPLLASFMFWRSGDTWDPTVLQHVMLFGMALQAIPFIATMLFTDDAMLGEEAAPVTEGGPPVGSDPQETIPLIPSLSGPERRKVRFGAHWRLRYAAFVPYLIACSDILYGLASGMTIKFFPVFFQDPRFVGLRPSSTNFVLAGQPLAIACGSLLAQRVSARLGRVQTMIVFKALGVTLITIMGVFTSVWQCVPLLIPMFLIRTSVNNACYPISRSILMDFVPKASRAKWNSFDAIVSWGWSGSAALGGILIHRHGYQITFLITACIQFCGWLVILLLLPLVPRTEGVHGSMANLVTPLHAGAEEGEEPDEDQCDPQR
eukprot:jgi/Botrbrau1/23501/Bobra.106_1s0052.1